MAINRPLFVHPDAGFLKRISDESTQFALTVSSKAEALLIIEEAKECLSSVFIYPNDLSVSTFKLIEKVIEKYPATPIFLIASLIVKENESLSQLLKQLPFQGIFSEKESYEGFVSFLVGQMDMTLKERSSLSGVPSFQGFQAVPVSDFYSRNHFPFDTYYMNNAGTLELMWTANALMDSKSLGAIAANRTALYFRNQDVEELIFSVRKIASKLDAANLPLSWHTSEVISSLKAVMEEARQLGIHNTVFEDSKNAIFESLSLVNRIETESASILNLIEQSQRAHRAIFSLFFSILICRNLKYEKVATVEIAGVASLLQDVSLFQTPFGDLSELLEGEFTPAQRTYYLQHPNMSAHLLSKHTPLSEVTLQVIRQAHEKRDRTGFPNRVGGLQLHPMAEILSLVNAYFEVRKQSSDLASTIQVLQNGVFMNGSPKIVSAFKLVLGDLIQEMLQAQVSGP